METVLVILKAGRHRTEKASRVAKTDNWLFDMIDSSLDLHAGFPFRLPSEAQVDRVLCGSRSMGAWLFSYPSFSCFEAEQRAWFRQELRALSAGSGATR